MIDLQHTDENLFKMPPLSWRFVTHDSGGPNEHEVPIMRDACADDLHHARLDGWDVAADGTVTPSVHFLDCGWHDMVRLIDWPADQQSASEGGE